MMKRGGRTGVNFLFIMFVFTFTVLAIVHSCRVAGETAAAARE